MSVMRGWSVCDRCSFNYRRNQMRKEATGFVVCLRCYDGAYDLIRHPQNRAAPPRREMLPIPDGRPDQNPLVYVLGLEPSGPTYALHDAGDVAEAEDGLGMLLEESETSVTDGAILTEDGETIGIAWTTWDVSQSIYIP